MRYLCSVAMSRECILEVLRGSHIINSVQNGEMAKDFPTMEGLEGTTAAAYRFTIFAKEHPELKFFVTPVGCGIAGYSPKQIAPLFSDAASLENVFLPLCFWKVLIQ